MIFPLAIITIFTAYLLYVRFKENKHRRLDSNYQETNKLLYSNGVLRLVAFLNLLLLGNFISHAFDYGDSPLAVVFILALAVLPIALFFYWSRNEKLKK